MDIIDFNSVKSKIERELCNKHNKHPKFEKTTKGFSIDACCEEFYSKLRERAKAVMAEEAKLAIQRMFKGWG